MTEKLLTLDEIEANVQRARLRVSPMQDAVYAALDSIRALVAHVRALENVTRMTDDRAFERITALEAKVAALSAADDVGRAAARAESATSPRMAQKAWAPVAEELDRLRAENAAQSKALEEALLLGKDALFAAQAREQKLAEENAELRKRVEAGAWPAPQPIETAPLGEILAGPAPNGFAWAPERPLAGCSLEHWRTQLREAERRWWLPMPPGGAKDQQPPKQKPARTCNIHSDCDAAVRHAHANGYEPEPCCNKKCDPDCDGHNCVALGLP